MSSTKVLIIGASGSLGGPVLNALVADPDIDVTILTRAESKSTFPEGVPVKKADYNSHESLVAAFAGFDAVVSIVATLAAMEQLKFVEAAVDAGIKRFYPTEFGSIPSNAGETVPEWWDLTGFHGKYEVYLRLQELADEGKLEYTLIANGPFFDWGLGAGFLGFNLKDKKATIFGSGDQVIATSNLAYVGKGTAYTLTHLDEFKNKAVRFYSYKISQNQLLETAEKVSGTKWEVERVTIDETVKGGLAGIEAGNIYAGYQVMQGLIFDENDKYGSNYTVHEVPVKDERTLEEVFEEALSRVA
ncbi:hypothetical protein ABW20_dc0106161 [Dactylellina cionopaga]|nr:hypothetical protein ABW20_dc0106161 [Dactylellina cionopaga]